MTKNPGMVTFEIKELPAPYVAGIIFISQFA